MPSEYLASAHRRGRPRAAFTLLELVIVVAVMAILAGAAVPVASKFFNSRARADTRQELDELAWAAREFFRDTGSLPSGAGALQVDPGLTGWAGPYLSVDSTEAWSGSSDSGVDAWSRGYAFHSLDASRLELRSAGEDGSFGDDSDILFLLDVTAVRREKTLEQLATLNDAIRGYNARYLPDAPLSSTLSSLLSRLVATKFLPDSTPFQADGWGDPFVADPAGKSPVVALASSNLPSSVASGGGGASTGKGSGKSGKGKKNGNGTKSGAAGGASKKKPKG